MTFDEIWEKRLGISLQGSSFVYLQDADREKGNEVVQESSCQLGLEDLPSGLQQLQLDCKKRLQFAPNSQREAKTDHTRSEFKVGLPLLTIIDEGKMIQRNRDNNITNTQMFQIWNVIQTLKELKTLSINLEYSHRPTCSLP